MTTVATTCEFAHQHHVPISSYLFPLPRNNEMENTLGKEMPGNQHSGNKQKSTSV
jgi:hypothetical protein